MWSQNGHLCLQNQRPINGSELYPIIACIWLVHQRRFHVFWYVMPSMIQHLHWLTTTLISRGRCWSSWTRYPEQALGCQCRFFVRPARRQVQCNIQGAAAATGENRRARSYGLCACCLLVMGQSIYHLQDAITRYGKVNGRAPRRLMFFRDGLSEGEYAGVGELEFQDIKGLLEAIKLCRMLIKFI